MKGRAAVLTLRWHHKPRGGDSGRFPRRWTSPCHWDCYLGRPPRPVRRAVWPVLRWASSPRRVCHAVACTPHRRARPPPRAPRAARWGQRRATSPPRRCVPRRTRASICDHGASLADCGAPRAGGPAPRVPGHRRPPPPFPHPHLLRPPFSLGFRFERFRVSCFSFRTEERRERGARGRRGDGRTHETEGILVLLMKS